MIELINMKEEERQQILTQVAAQTGLPEGAVEKDMWVTLLLEALFSLPVIGVHLLFKGGTSLSKGYGLIDRFSEDIDFALDRKLLGFKGELSRTTITKKLRPASALFIRDILVPQLRARLVKMGLSDASFEIIPKPDAVNDADPLPVYVYYKTLFQQSEYLSNRVEIEIGLRSLMVPAEIKIVRSLINEAYPTASFSGTPFPVLTVLPGRTFLEKVFLLHEQFLLSPEKALPKNRMSRHLYDVEKLMDTEYARQAMENAELYKEIIAHRQLFTPVPTIQYDKHLPLYIDFIPPASVSQAWRTDYASLAENMIGGHALGFDDLLSRLEELRSRFRELDWFRL